MLVVYLKLEFNWVSYFICKSGNPLGISYSEDSECILNIQKLLGIPVVAQWVTNLTNIHEDKGSFLASLSGLKIWHCCGCGVGQRLQLRFHL